MGTLPRFASSRATLIATLSIACGLLAAPFAHAGPADKVYLPHVDYRELEFELRGGWENFNGTRDGDGQQFVFDVGYGITPRWFSEIAVFYSKSPNAGGQIDEFKSENIFLLTEPGEHWLDVGFLAEFVRNRAEGLNELEFGPLFQKEIGREQFNLNFEFSRELVDGAKTNLGYAWQWKHRGNPALEFGLQGFGGAGALGDLGQVHEFKLGPAIFGSAKLPSGQKLKYDGAILLGATDETPDTTLRFQLEYEFAM